MTRNESQKDRLMRGVLGVILLGVAFFGGLTGGLFWLALILGAIALFTSLTGFCPLYRALGINTCNKS